MSTNTNYTPNPQNTTNPSQMFFDFNEGMQVTRPKIPESQAPIKKKLDINHANFIISEYKSFLIDRDTAIARLRVEANYPSFLGVDRILIRNEQQEQKKENKSFNLGYGEMSNGTVVWNRNKEIDNDYETVAHIQEDGSINYKTNDIPDSIKKEIEEAANSFYKNNTNTEEKVKNNNHGFGRSQAGIERRLNVNFDKKLDKWTEQVERANEKYVPKFQPYGSWTNFNGVRLSNYDRNHYNKASLEIIEKSKTQKLDQKDLLTLRRYSGFGGIDAGNERGVLYDYYTSPPVAHITWQLLNKICVINGSKVLEPSCGTGVFFEYAPKDKSLSFTGVELDKRTSQIAQLIHTNENTEVKNMSFEAFNLSDKSGEYDLVIGNAPFGERSAALSSLDMPNEKSLDNYFVSRSIDNLKEGGTMALIVAPGVLENKTNENFRLELCKKASFIGAVKLPNRSFHHTHTQVMPDILLFQKLPKDIQSRLSALDDNTFKLTPAYDDIFVSGKYFEHYQKHIAGELSKGTGQWGNDEVKGDISLDNMEQIISSFTPSEHFYSLDKNAIDNIRDNYELPKVSKIGDTLNLSNSEIVQLDNKQLRHGAIKLLDNKVYILSDKHSWHLASENKILVDKLLDIKIISSQVHTIQQAMQIQNDPSLKLANNRIPRFQEECKKLLSEYQQKYKTLPADDPDIKRFTRDNPAVQGIYEALLAPTDPLLTEKNVYKKDVEIVDGHNMAITTLLTLREKMKDGTEENIRAMFPLNVDTLIEEMKNHNDIFFTTQGYFQLREDFISGDAWKKIDELKETAQNESIKWKKELLLRGADELEKAVGWTPIEEADFSPRSSWISPEIVRNWVSSGEGLGKSIFANLVKNDEGKWGITHYNKWQEYNDSITYYLNGQKQRSRNIDTDAYNKEHDDLFRSYISNHEEYRKLLESEYNRKFKTHIIAPVKTYPVEIKGWRNAEEGGKTVKPHQWQSIHHLYRNQCGISALGTGFGKTVTAISLMSLLRQEGKAHRIFLQVPNNKIKDWIEEIHDVMPSLKIASIDPEEPGYSSRDKRYAKYQAMARSDADIILMPESSASEIGLSPENDKRVSENVAFNYKLEKADGTARQQQKAELKGEKKAVSGKTNVTVCFEDFGCDALFVDEAHRYKNLFTSSLSRETGMNDGRQSDKAMSLYKKSEYIREHNQGKNVYLLTATPLTNSPLEYYNMLQYIAPDELRRMGVSTIDGFIREFANIEYGWLYDWSKGQPKEGNILTGFKNLQTLQNLFFTYTDLQNNPDAIGLDKPKAENKPHIIPADKKQMSVVKQISDRLESYKKHPPDVRKEFFPGENFLTFYSRLRTVSLDLELYDPHKYKNWKNPKLETLAKNAFESYQKTKGGQVIFCDRVFSSDASFNIHEKIKAELIAQGYKEKDIVIVNGFTKSGGNKNESVIEKECSKAVADYNAGKYKVIIGSTACIGEGLNLQKNSSSVHHFDIPFRPSDFIQRNGRVDRQGNEQDKVDLNTYLSAGTIDNYSVNLVQRKANWIDQMLRTKSDVFTNPNDDNAIDADELLLALTEEWGDKEKAVERRAELEKQKELQINEAQTKQMKGHLKSLSLALGSLEPLMKNKDSAEYKKRLTQINNLEAALKNNPVFTRLDLFENREPFLYNSDKNKIFRKGDVFITNYNTFQIDSINFKKQEIDVTELVSDETKHERKIKHYGDYSEKTLSLFEICGSKNKWSSSEAIYHIEKASKETAEIARTAGSISFYSLPEDVKEKYYYNLHLLISDKHSNTCNPVVFHMDKENNLKVGNLSDLRSNEGKLLNPFSAKGKKAINSALEKGIDFPDYYIDYNKELILKTLSKTIPELKTQVEKAMLKNENKQEAIKAALIEKAEKTMNADKNHLQSKVSVVGLRI